MRSFLCCLLSFLLLGGFCSAGEIDKYRESDLHARDPAFIFVYYDGEEKGKCMACERYKPWVASLGTEVKGFKVKWLNFGESPRLALRFRTTQFPTFFLQYGQLFKNLSEVDFYDLNIAYEETLYKNDIDAILRNVHVLEKIPTISGMRAPSSFFSLVYSYVFSCALLLSHVVDAFTGVVPIWVLLLSVFVLLVSTNLFKSYAWTKHSKVTVPE
ncbi:hypothetical protein NECID01_1346 [Nematocida sp. AWRm77]|nr:hypothetical protein NECID01_1346 [Nematocida sp. AWRm77]